MPDTIQHPSLIVGVLDLLHLDHLCLLQHLDRVEAVIVLRLHQVHPAKTTGTKGAL